MSTKKPTVAIVYSWEDESHKKWVHNLATRLRRDGVNVTLDRPDVALGDQIPEFMEKAIRENQFVVIICTPLYKQRSDSRMGGVGYEVDLMTAEMLNERNQRKFIPVLRSGEWDESAPSWLKGKLSVDLSGDPYSEEKYRKLLDTLLGNRPIAPPIGEPNRPSHIDLKPFRVAGYNRWKELTACLRDDSPACFPKGYYEMSFALVGAKPVTGSPKLEQFLKAASKANQAGWHPFWFDTHKERAPRRHPDFIEAWLGKQVYRGELLRTTDSDYWRASTDGKLYTISGYMEDDEPEFNGSILFSEPIHNLAEGILYACRLASHFEGVERLVIFSRFTGLNERCLKRYVFRRTVRRVPNSTAHTEKIDLCGETTLEEVRDNLAEVVYEILGSLYELFNYDGLSSNEVQSILKERGLV